MAFKTNRAEKILNFSFEEELTPEVAAKVMFTIQDELKRIPFEMVVFSLGVHDFNFRSFRVLTPFAQQLKAHKIHIYICTEEKRIHKLIRNEGLDTLLKTISSIQEVLGSAIITSEQAANAQRSRMDVNFINPFIEGTLLVLDTQAQTKATAEKPCLKGPDSLRYQTDIAGILEINCTSFKGGIALCFPEGVFLSIMSRMLGESYGEITPDLEDGAAEILNIVFGHAKTVLNTKGHSFEKALPTILRAPNIALDHISPKGAIILPFRTDDGIFCMEIRAS